MAKSTLLCNIATALDNLVTLEIVTTVGPVDFAVKDAEDLAGKADVKGIYSRHNLLQGDVTTQMDEAFAAGEYKDLLSFHADRVKEGQEVISQNLQALKELYRFVRDDYADPAT